MGNINLTPEQMERLSTHLDKDDPTEFNPIPKEVPTSNLESNSFSEHVQPTTPLKKRIQELESEYYKDSGSISTAMTPSVNYKDDIGNDTFYVKNLSNGHLILSDIDVVIKKGEVIDLLQRIDLATCYSSKDIRRELSGTRSADKKLKRLTQSEYVEEMEAAIQAKKRIDVMRNQESIRQKQNNQNTTSPFQNPSIEPSEQKVRPLILGKLEKLRLSYDKDPENSKFGISPIEFIQWVMIEPLSEEELNNILGDPIVARNHDIKAAVVQKMTTM